MWTCKGTGPTRAVFCWWEWNNGWEIKSASKLAISSRPIPEAQHLLATAKAHWIEYGLPWSLDMDFREDESRVCTGHTSRNLCLLPCMVLNLIRQDTTIKAGVTIQRRKASRNLAYMETVPSLA